MAPACVRFSAFLLPSAYSMLCAAHVSTEFLTIVVADVKALLVNLLSHQFNVSSKSVSVLVSATSHVSPSITTINFLVESNYLCSPTCIAQAHAQAVLTLRHLLANCLLLTGIPLSGTYCHVTALVW